MQPASTASSRAPIFMSDQRKTSVFFGDGQQVQDFLRVTVLLDKSSSSSSIMHLYWNTCRHFVL